MLSNQFRGRYGLDTALAGSGDRRSSGVGGVPDQPSCKIIEGITSRVTARSLIISQQERFLCSAEYMFSGACGVTRGEIDMPIHENEREGWILETRNRLRHPMKLGC